MPQSDPFEHFVAAQADARAGFAAAIAELQAGRKTGHWIWYMFPQIEGLGRSEVSQRFALRGSRDAKDYMAHALLGPRLLQALQVVLGQATHTNAAVLTVLMGSSLDAQKLVSSCTLFALAAARGSQTQAADVQARTDRIRQTCERLLASAHSQGLGRCELTRAALNRDSQR